MRSKGHRAGRKPNYAVDVMLYMPLMTRKRTEIDFHTLRISVVMYYYRTCYCIGRYIFCYCPDWKIQRPHGRVIRSQAAAAETAGLSAQQVGSRARCPFLAERILRSSGFGAGTVRNAATGPHRWHFRHRGSAAIWLFTRCLLSRAGCVQSLRPSRTFSTAERAKAGPQAHRQDRSAHGAGQEQRSGPTGIGSCHDGPRSIRTVDSSAKYRESLGQGSKKGASGATVILCGDPDGIWERRYEILRHAAIATSDRPWGLAVMVLQGLAAWMRACPQADQTNGHTDTSLSPGHSSSTTSPHSSNEVASVMTDMLLSSCLNRAI